MLLFMSCHSFTLLVVSTVIYQPSLVPSMGHNSLWAIILALYGCGHLAGCHNQGKCGQNMFAK